MSSCFPPAPLNPINEALLGVFGDNFFPPYNASFQPFDKSLMINEKLLQMQLPGGGAIKPIGEPHKSLSEILTPITGALGTVFSFFGPLFLILDLIRAVIDILCALLNPEPMIAALVDMFLTVVPPVAALFPPLASILLALNTVKLVIAIIVSLTTAIIAIIDIIVENALSISDLIQSGDIRAIDAVTTKICVLLSTFGNELGALAPISFILQMLELFMSLGSKFFCASDAACCNTAQCPAIIMDPPSGTGTVQSTQVEVNIKDIIPILPISDDLAEDIIFVQPQMVLHITGVSDLATLANYIVDPSKIPAASADAATISIRITNTDTDEVITVPAIAATSSTITVKADNFPANTPIEYEIRPDKLSLIKLNLISLGCEDDVIAAGEGVRSQIDETARGIGIVSGGNNRSGFESLLAKIGRSFPPIPDYSPCLNAQTADPTQSQADCVSAISNAYIDEVKDFGLDLVCLGASRTASVFESSRVVVSADGLDSATISLTVKEASGASLLANFLPNIDIPQDLDAQFVSSIGTMGPTVFDATEGVFRATLTAEDVGTALITSAFVVKGSVCMIPGFSDGFTIIDKVLEVEFTRPGGVAPRRRPQSTYVQSAGGRVR